MPAANPGQWNFNGGELSPTIEGRVDINKYSNGCSVMRGFIPLVQGPARRRSGTRFVAEVKNSANRTWLVPFEFSDAAAFQIEFGDLYLRFYTNHGVVETAPGSGIPYEIAAPWTAAELINADGTFRLWMEQSGDVVYIASGSRPLYKLTRIANTNWTLAIVDLRAGPFIGVDPDETRTVYASAATGAGITLTASAPIFTTAHIGSLFLLESKHIDAVPQWEVGKVIPAGPVERRSDGNVYQNLNAATTGTIKPVHTEGSRYDGDAGVQWQYLHSGYGWVRITAVGGGGTTATADVISRIPSQAVGAGNPTSRWSFSELSEDRGYPTQVTFFRERLWLFRRTQAFASVVADFENFANRDGADVTPDMAISIDIAGEQVNDVVWVAPGAKLLVGTLGGEFAIGELSASDPLGPANIQAQQQTSHGSKRVRPLRVNDSTLFVQKSGRKLREIRFTFESDGYATTDLTVLADHITKGLIAQMAYQQEPHSICWACCNDGSLIGFTFNREQDVLAWHPHPIGGTGVFVESVSTIPSPDGARDDLWMIVRRTINGVTRRYVEFLERDFISIEGMTLLDAFFVDSGLTFNGFVPGATAAISTFNPTPTWQPGETGVLFVTGIAFAPGDVGDCLVLVSDTTGEKAQVRIDVITSPTTADVTYITPIPLSLQAVVSNNVSFARDGIAGLDHLEGQTLQVLADGASHPDVVVSGGAVALHRWAVVAQIGLGFEAALRTMRIEAGAQLGTAQGKVKRIHKLVVRLLDTLGGLCGPNAENLDEIMYRSSADPMDNPPPLVTGDSDLIDFPGDYEMEGRILVTQPQPLPMTIVALMPELVTQG